MNNDLLHGYDIEALVLGRLNRTARWMGLLGMFSRDCWKTTLDRERAGYCGALYSG